MKKNIIYGVLALFLEFRIFIIFDYLLSFPSFTDIESKSIILDI